MPRCIRHLRCQQRHLNSVHLCRACDRRERGPASAPSPRQQRHLVCCMNRCRNKTGMNIQGHPGASRGRGTAKPHSLLIIFLLILILILILSLILLVFRLILLCAAICVLGPVLEAVLSELRGQTAASGMGVIRSLAITMAAHTRARGEVVAGSCKHHAKRRRRQRRRSARDNTHATTSTSAGDPRPP